MDIFRDKLRKNFERTVEDGLDFDGSFESLNYYNLFVKAGTADKLIRIKGNNVCMFNCQYENCDAVLMIFSIPINVDEVGVKHIAERVMEVVEMAESCFVTVDSINSKEIKEEKFVYVTLIKKVECEAEE